MFYTFYNFQLEDFYYRPLPLKVINGIQPKIDPTILTD